MKNVTSLKTNKTESPKTPGGISKSLLTPCRRLGLSRKWKKDGPSPFVSPLSGSIPNTAEVKVEKRETRKRKERVLHEETEEISEETPETPVENEEVLDESVSVNCSKNDTIVGTPSRSVGIPRKKSKTLLSSIAGRTDKCSSVIATHLEVKEPSELKINEIAANPDIEDMNKDNVEVIKAVSTPILTKSKIKTKKNMPPSNTTSKLIDKDDKIDSKIEIKENIDEINKTCKETKVKAISPNELTKKCIVVIQKKIFKTNKSETTTNEDKSKIRKNSVSQTLFDSDSDEMPLAQLNKKENIDTLKVIPEIITIDEDDDFTETKTVKVKKLEDKNTSTTSLIKTKIKPEKTCKVKKPKILETKPAISNTFDDDEDFEFEKRTILIKRTYDKVTKPLKAKSTGSITQKDIDELKARIEMKKKMLLAKAVTEDTAELRGLIKKWQKGCQDALMELMELMKTKFPEKQNMDYSEILQTLQIPSNLVGYDEENDCFNTPDDANIILSKFNDS